MKKLTWFFSAGVAGVVISFAMSIYTAVIENKHRTEASKVTIPLPANAGP